MVWCSAHLWCGVVLYTPVVWCGAPHIHQIESRLPKSSSSDYQENTSEPFGADPLVLADNAKFL